MEDPKEYYEGRQSAWEQFYAKTSEAATDPSTLNRDQRIRHAIATSYGKTGFMEGFDAGVAWLRSTLNEGTTAAANG